MGRYAAGLSVAVVAVAGCTTSSDGPGTPPASAPTSTSSTSTSAPASSSTATASPSGTATSSADTGPPQLARENTPEGAQKFALYAGSIFDRAFSESNSSLLDSISVSTCKTCSGAKSAIDHYKDQNQHFLGRWANFTDPTYSNSINGVTRVIVMSEQTGAKIVDSNGSIVKTIPPTKGNLSVQLVFNDMWRISEIQGVA